MIQLSKEEANLYKDCPVVLDFDSGFYIFPVSSHPYYSSALNIIKFRQPNDKGVVKMAMHIGGYTYTDAGVSTPRTVTTDVARGLLIPKRDIQQMRGHLREVYPSLADKAFSATRLCWYCQ